jgi:hypothetical protein
MMMNIDLQILTDLHVLSLPEYGKVFFGISVCMYVYVDVPC